MYKPILYPNGKGTVVIEKENTFRLAKIKANSCFKGNYSSKDALVKSILLPYRYLPKNFEYEDFEFSGDRRGRTSEAIIKDKEAFRCKDFPDAYYHMLSFKGTGARRLFPSETYFIDPTRHFGEKKWWGTINEAHAKGEAWNKCLKKLKISHTPYVSINLLPLEVENEIYNQSLCRPQRYRPDAYTGLCQVVRLFQTNIRLDDEIEDKENFKKACDKAGWTPEYLIDLLAKEDIKICLAEKRLNSEGKTLYMSEGLISDNRFWTGEFTDLEQIKISSIDKREKVGRRGWPCRSLAENIIKESSYKYITNKLAILFGVHPEVLSKDYFRKVSHGIDFKIGPHSYLRDIDYYLHKDYKISSQWLSF